MALLPLMKVCWSVSLCIRVFGSDATLHGYASDFSECSASEVWDAYRWSDRWIFVLEPSFAPRGNAFASGLADEQFQNLRERDDSGIQALLDVALDPTFPELDRSVIRRCTWNLI